MKNSVVVVAFCCLLGLTSCSKFPGHGGGSNSEEIVAVANRGDGTVSFLNAKTNELIDTIDLPGEAEPMYVVYVSRTDKVYVGDRAQSQVHVIDPDTYEVENSIDVGEGVFHMWADGNGAALWVSNDIDNAISVVDLSTNTLVETIALDGKPHDVFLTYDGSMGFVSVLRPDAPDQVYSFNALSYEQIGMTDVGEDPHLFHLSKKDKLFVPCQNTNQLLTLDGSNLDVLADTPLDGAHGVFATLDQKSVYVTGINVSALYQVRAANSKLSRPATTTSLPIPHNLVVNARATKVFVTHSGANSNQISVFKIAHNKSLSEKTVIATGTNPFGLAYYRR